MLSVFFSGLVLFLLYVALILVCLFVCFLGRLSAVPLFSPSYCYCYFPRVSFCLLLITLFVVLTIYVTVTPKVIIYSLYSSYC